MIYFTSDLHLGHGNIIKYCNRPFKNAEEMDESIIARWNGRVEKDDTVYILGDFTKAESADVINAYLCRLKGRKILIAGNHDDFIKQNAPLLKFDGVYDYKELKTGGVYAVLFHYPILSWNRMQSGAVCLHGHVHGKTADCLGIENLYDVGVDAHDFLPVTLMEVITNAERR